MGQAGGKSEKAVAGRKKIAVHRTNVFKPKTVDIFTFTTRLSHGGPFSMYLNF
jgi:hypothetical protein